MSNIIESFTPEQAAAFAKFKQGKNLFIGGPGGSGKSFFIKAIVENLYQRGIIHQVTSTTGCSSILLSNSIRINDKPITVKTIHSWSGIRLGKGTPQDILKNVKKRNNVVKEWKRNRVLVIDEVSMLSMKLFNVLDLIGRSIRNCPDLPFGGMQVIFLGDFYQLPPVGDREEPDSARFCFESLKWFETFPIENHIEFTRIFRQSDDDFKEILNQVRCGNLSTESCQRLMERVDVPYDPEEHEGILPVKIFATRNQVAAVNKKHYDELTEEEHVYTISVTTNTTKYIDSGNYFEEDVLEKISMMSPIDIDYECKSMIQNITMDEIVRLKQGTTVMCLVNLDINLGIANGSMGRIENFVYSLITKEYVPVVRFMNGVVQPIERYVWQNTEYPNICVAQIPLCLAYANSIHKMQGSTLDVCEMNLGSSIFAEHQTYVALSRVRSLDGLYLTAFHPQRIRVNPLVVEFYSKFIREFDAGVSLDDIKIEEEAIDLSAIRMNECPICLDSREEPYITACKHVFCHSCILRHINCNIRECATCPMCRESVSVNTIKPISKIGGCGSTKKYGYGNGGYGGNRGFSSGYKVKKLS